MRLCIMELASQLGLLVYTHLRSITVKITQPVLVRDNRNVEVTK